MTDAEATRWIILAMTVLGVSAVARSLSTARTLPSVRVPIAIAIAGSMLALGKEAAPGVAGGLAALIVLTTVLSAGRVWDVVENLTT